MDRGTRGLLLATGACILGCGVLIAIGDSSLMTFLGISLGGIAFVLVLSTVFYAVGRSEDRERATRAGSADAASESARSARGDDAASR